MFNNFVQHYGNRSLDGNIWKILLSVLSVSEEVEFVQDGILR